MILEFGGKTPLIRHTAFIAPDSWVIGDVELADDVSLFFGVVLRGDLQPIRVGARTNLQEHAVVHTSHNRSPAVIGEEVTVGHRALIHGARIAERVIVGMGSIILDDAIVEAECIIGAGTIITENKRIPPRSLVYGSPGKVIRTLSEDELRFLAYSADGYVQVARELALKLGS